MLTREEYIDYCTRFKKVVSFLKVNSKPADVVAREICNKRKYMPERMTSILVEAGFMFIEDSSCYEKLRSAGDDLALFSSNGTFLLEGRYIFPVYDMLGNPVALIGWFPDEKKYITTPSKLFSKSCLFYGMEQLSRTGIGKDYVLVEGIFDCLSVRSIGLPCVAQMGIDSSRYKRSMYSLFKSFVAIPDKDSEGRKVINSDKWKLPSSSKYFKWSGDKSKDIDILCNSYEEEDIRDLLLEVFSDSDRVVNKQIG